MKERITQKQLKIDTISQSIATGIHSPTLLSNLEKAEDFKQILEQELSLKSNVSEHEIISIDVIKFVLQDDINSINSKQSLKNLVQKWIKKIEVQSDDLLIYFYFDSEPLCSYLRVVATVGLEPTTYRKNFAYIYIFLLL